MYPLIFFPHSQAFQMRGEAATRGTQFPYVADYDDDEVSDSDPDSDSDQSTITISDDEQHNNHNNRGNSSNVDKTTKGKVPHHPHNLPQPNPPARLTKSMSSFGKYLLDGSTGLSSAIFKRMSSHKESSDSDRITEFNLSGLKVIVKQKEHDSEICSIKGRISFFTRSNCRDCTAVRLFFRDSGLPYVEINIDVFPEREKELVERTGASSVPQIFFNDRLLGGLVALNSLRNSGEFDTRLREMAGVKCTDSAPKAPVYGIDEEEVKERSFDVMMPIVKVLRQKLSIQDRLTKMKIVKNCFSGSDMVDIIVRHHGCSRDKAVEIGRELARKHFLHHVFQENDFEDGNNQFYRFLEHEPSIHRCFNFIGTTNDDEPKTASAVGRRLTNIMSAILEAYASEDRSRLDYKRIASSEEFRRYVKVVQDLQRVNLFALSVEKRMAFFLNLYNAMVIHAVIRIGSPGIIDRGAFFTNDFQYIVGGYPYSLSTIKHGILRLNKRQPYSFSKPFNVGDKRLELVLPKLNPLIHFGLCNGTLSGPAVRFFSPEGVEMQLRYAAREYFLRGGVDVNLGKRTVYITRIIKWYNMDFGQEMAILKWILYYLDATKAGLLTHLLNDGGPVNIGYQDFDWSLNSY